VIDNYFGFTDLKGGRPGKTRILRDGKITEVDVLSGPNNPEIIQFPEPLGELEAFYTGAPFDTITHLDLHGVTEAWEKTLRWPGHCEIWLKLINLHLLDRDPVLVKGCEIAPRDMFIEVGMKHLQYEKGEGDVVVERVAVTGKQNAKTVTYTYELIDFYDPATDTTAMGRTTAVPCSIVSQMLARGAIPEKGIVHPSKLGWDRQLAAEFFKELTTRNIPIRESTTTSLT
jgi:lysine 6-dehydrogenase